MEDLQERLAALEVELDKCKKEKHTSVTKVLQSAQKLRKYSGNSCVKTWIADANRYISFQDLADRNAADFIVNHLEGAAREEIRYCLDESKCTVKEVFDALRNAFREKVTVNEALDLFAARKQQDKESLRDYSYSLMSLLERAVAIDPMCVVSKDLCLRDRFVENVRDHHLRKYLKSQVRARKDMKFQDVRDEAIQWAEEDTVRCESGIKMKKKVELKMNTVSGMPEDTRIDAFKVSENSSVFDSKLEALVEVQKRQQELLEKQQKMILDLVQKCSTSGMQENKKADIGPCFFCNRPGHIKKNCFKYKRSLQKDAVAPTQNNTSLLPQSNFSLPQGAAGYSPLVQQSHMWQPAQMGYMNPQQVSYNPFVTSQWSPDGVNPGPTQQTGDKSN